MLAIAMTAIIYHRRIARAVYPKGWKNCFNGAYFHERGNAME